MMRELDAPGTARVSTMAEGLIGSEILKIAADIRALAAQGRRICNLTVGDFRPSDFRIPGLLAQAIEEALRSGETNYPPSDGVLVLREAVRAFYERSLGLRYPIESILIAGGARPAIYATYRALVDRGDRVVFPVPSWNNNHYTHLTDAVPVPVVCHSEDAFLPTRANLKDAVRGARLLALNSPLNPSGTAYGAAALEGICDLVLEENRRRAAGDRPLYLMYDQVYWMLTFGSTRHVDPVSLRPELAPYVVFVDGISKPFAATGLRVGWAVGPADVVDRMASILGHVGAWAPRAEQIATARLLNASGEVAAYHDTMKRGVQARLDRLHDGLMDLRRAGFPLDAIAPMGAIYLSARFALNGRRTPAGEPLHTNEQIRAYLLHAADLAVVQFQAFGSSEETGWFRLSVGAVSLEEIDAMLPRLRRALESLAG
jgi:aspartate aminotransferase